MKKNLIKFWNIVSTTLVVIIVLCAVFLMGSRLMGYRCYTIISGSMEPQYSVGDLIYVKNVDVNTITVGEPITFVLNEELVVATHRVVRVDTENQHFYTKGDANEIEDSDPVHFNNVIGVPQFSIPKLGYVSAFVQNPPGMYITVGVGIVLILLVFFSDMRDEKKRKQDAEIKAAAVQSDMQSAVEENERLKAEVEKLRAEKEAKTSDDTE